MSDLGEEIVNKKFFGLIRYKGIGEDLDHQIKLSMSANLLVQRGFHVGQLKITEKYLIYESFEEGQIKLDSLLKF
jgi:hypothetical protein